VRSPWGDAPFDTVPRPVLRGSVGDWLEIVVQKLVGPVGFVVQLKRWVVERMFGWFNRQRPSNN